MRSRPLLLPSTQLTWRPTSASVFARGLMLREPAGVGKAICPLHAIRTSSLTLKDNWERNTVVIRVL